MKSYKTRGIIIRKQDFSETDRLLTVYTYDYGKIRILAKGVKKTLSRLSGHLELFYISDLVIYKGKNLDIVTGANFIRKFDNLEESENSNCAAYYICELIYYLCEENEKNTDVFDLLICAMEKINNANYINIINFFELKLFQKLGHQPEVEKCIICSNKTSEGKYYFDYHEGGIICFKCSSGYDKNIELNTNELKLLKLIKKFDIDYLRRLKIKEHSLCQLSKCISSMRDNILEKNLKSANFL